MSYLKKSILNALVIFLSFLQKLSTILVFYLIMIKYCNINITDSIANLGLDKYHKLV